MNLNKFLSSKCLLNNNNPMLKYKSNLFDRLTLTPLKNLSGVVQDFKTMIHTLVLDVNGKIA